MDGGGGFATVGGGFAEAGAGFLYLGGSGFFEAESEAGLVLLNPRILFAVHPCRSSFMSTVSSVIETSCMSSILSS